MFYVKSPQQGRRVAYKANGAFDPFDVIFCSPPLFAKSVKARVAVLVCSSQTLMVFVEESGFSLASEDIQLLVKQEWGGGCLKTHAHLAVAARGFNEILSQHVVPVLKGTICLLSPLSKWILHIWN